MRRCIIPSVTKLSLLTETRPGTVVELERLFTARFHPSNINREGGIEIPEAWMPTVRQHNSRSPPQRSPDGSVSSSDDTVSALDRKPPTMVRDTPITNNQGGTNSPTQ